MVHQQNESKEVRRETFKLVKDVYDAVHYSNGGPSLIERVRSLEHAVIAHVDQVAKKRRVEDRVELIEELLVKHNYGLNVAPIHKEQTWRESFSLTLGGKKAWMLILGLGLLILLALGYDLTTIWNLFFPAG